MSYLMRDPELINRIKTAIRSNFEQSPDLYDKFETDFGFFRELNSKLTAGLCMFRGARILDIGCGTGASTSQLIESFPSAKIWALDISPAMLDRAKQNINNPNITFIQGDAAALDKLFTDGFDAIVYSASIFLIPDYVKSLEQTKKLLKSSGSVFFTFMDGVYSDDENLFKRAETSLQLGISLKKPVMMSEFKGVFEGLFTQSIHWQEDFALKVEQLRQFFSVPAMSAGLFPSISYPLRVEKINSLFDYIEKLDMEILFRWHFFKASVD
jgi:ubiquinone/menaquinone biosynthesis C-methylase UbiE